MRETGSFASLSPKLLARKGRARPAMRPQIQPLVPFRDAMPAEWQDDLGWNDMGDPADPAANDGDAGLRGGEVVAFDPAACVPMPADPVPAVLRQQAEIAGRIAAPSRRSALSEGRRAAFTLRLDAQRHLALRLACTVGNRSAQAIVTEALDRLIADMPEIAELADAVRKKKR